MLGEEGDRRCMLSNDQTARLLSKRNGQLLDSGKSERNRCRVQTSKAVSRYRCETTGDWEKVV